MQGDDQFPQKFPEPVFHEMNCVSDAHDTTWCLASDFLLKNTNYCTSLKALPSWLKASKNMPTYGCLIREAIVTSEVFFFMSPMQGFGQWYSVHEFLMQVVAPCSYHGCCQVTHVPCFEITLYLCHLSHVPFPHNISCFSCPQKLPTNPVISYHHSHCCPLPFRIAKTPCFCLFSLWLHFLVNLLLPAPSFQWPFPRQCPRMQQRSYHTQDDSSCFGRWEGGQAVWPNGVDPFPQAAVLWETMDAQLLGGWSLSKSLCPGWSHIWLCSFLSGLRGSKPCRLPLNCYAQEIVRQITCGTSLSQSFSHSN